MEQKIMEPLLERAEEYGKVSYQLLRLKTIDKSVDVTSSLLSRFPFLCCMLIFLFAVNMGVGLWLGKILGQNYLGFLIVASFYLFAGMVFLLIRKSIKSKVYNILIKQILK